MDLMPEGNSTPSPVERVIYVGPLGLEAFERLARTLGEMGVFWTSDWVTTPAQIDQVLQERRPEFISRADLEETALQLTNFRNEEVARIHATRIMNAIARAFTQPLEKKWVASGLKAVLVPAEELPPNYKAADAILLSTASVQRAIDERSLRLVPDLGLLAELLFQAHLKRLEEGT